MMWDASLVLCTDTSGDQFPASTRHSRSIFRGCNAPHIDTVQLHEEVFPLNRDRALVPFQMILCEIQPPPMAHLCQQSPEHLSTKPAGQECWRALQQSSSS